MTPLHVASLGLAAGTLSAAAAGLPGWWMGLVVGAGYGGYRWGRRSIRPVVPAEPAVVTATLGPAEKPELDILEELRIEQAAIAIRQNQARARLGELFDLVEKMRKVDAKLYAARIARARTGVDALSTVIADNDVELTLLARAIAMAEIERDSVFLDEVSRWRELAAEHAERRLIAEANEEVERLLRPLK